MTSAVTPRHLNAATPERWAEVLGGPADIAAEWLRAAAEQGVADAQLVYGQRLLDGIGVQKDAAQALAWFKAAADADLPMAMNMVGRCYENGWGTAIDMLVATYWFRLAAQRGLDWGMYNYATSLILGRGVPVDRAEALAWLHKATALGHAKSWNILGGFHEDGWESAVDLDLALDCYRRAAEGGDFRGQFNAARLLADRGAMPQALRWLAQAPRTATPAFMQKMRSFLRQSPHPAFRRIAEQF